MAVAYKSAGAGGGTESNGASLDLVCPATVDAGDILIAHVIKLDTTTSPSTPGGWTLLHGPQNVGITVAGRAWVFGKIADGTEDGATIGFGTTGGTAGRFGRIYSYSGRTSGTISQLVNRFSSFASDSDPNGPKIRTTVTGALAVALVCQDDNNSIAAFTGMTGGTWAESVAEYTSTTLGAQGCMCQAQHCTPTGNPGLVYGGTYNTANDKTNVIGFQILPAPTTTWWPDRIDARPDCAFPESSSFIGPFQDGNGNLYTIFERPYASTDPDPGAYKSTDGGATWTEMDAANAPAWSTYGDLESFQMVQGAQALWGISHREATNGIEYYVFRTSDNASPDTWDTGSTARITATAGAYQAASVVRRSDGDLIAFYLPVFATNEQIAYKIKPSGGAWGSEKYLSITNHHVTQPVAVLGESDKTYVFAADDTDNEILFWTIDSSDTVAGPTSVSTNVLAFAYDETSGLRCPMATPAVYWDDGGTECIYVAWISSTSTLVGCKITEGSVGSVETIYNSTVRSNPGSTDSFQPIATLAVYNGRVWAVFSDSASGDMWCSERESDGTWTSAVEVRDGVTIDYVSAKPFTYSSRQYMGVVTSENSEGATDGTPSFDRFLLPLERLAEITGASGVVAAGTVIAGAPSVSRSAELNAAGAIAVEVLHEVPRAAALDAAGAITAADVVVRPRAAALDAAGAITASAASVRDRAVALDGAASISASGLVERSASAAVDGAGAIQASGVVVGIAPRAVITWVALYAPTKTGIPVFSRAASLNGVSAIEAAGYKIVSRSAAIGATGAIEVTANRIVERYAAVSASGSIAVGVLHEVPRAAAIGASTAITVATLRIVERSAAVGASGSIAVAGQRIVERTAALTASGAIEVATTHIAVRSVAISATGAIEVGVVRQVSRAAAVSASGSITVAFQRDQTRSAALGATGTISAAGEIGGKVERDAQVDATGSISVTGICIRSRAAAVTATGTTSVAGAGWQALRPGTDSVDGTWTNELEGTDLVGSIDEGTANDADYIHSATTLPSSCRFKLTTASVPLAGQRMLRYRAGGEGGSSTLTVSLRQGGGNVLGGGTLVNQFVHTLTDVVLIEDEVTGDITDYSDLYVELVAS